MVIYPSEKRGFVAEILCLKECLAQGETLQETLEELIIIRDLWLETARKKGTNLPDEKLAISQVKALSL